MAKESAIKNRLNILENMYLSETPFIIREKSKGVSGTFSTAILQLGLVSRRKDGLYTYVAEVPTIEIVETVFAKEKKIWAKSAAKPTPIVSTTTKSITPKAVVNSTKTSKEEVVITPTKVKEYAIRVNSETKEVILPLKSFIELIQ